MLLRSTIRFRLPNSSCPPLTKILVYTAAKNINVQINNATYFVKRRDQNLEIKARQIAAKAHAATYKPMFFREINPKDTKKENKRSLVLRRANPTDAIDKADVSTVSINNSA